jgi:hypothetical protein
MQKKSQIHCHPLLEALPLQGLKKDQKLHLKLQTTQTTTEPMKQMGNKEMRKG